MALPSTKGLVLVPVVTGSDQDGYSVQVELVYPVQFTPVAADQVPLSAKIALGRYLDPVATESDGPDGDWYEVSDHGGLGGGWTVFAHNDATA